MKVSFARKEAFTQQSLGAFQPFPFLELAAVGDQDVADLLRMADEEEVLPAKSQVGHVAVLPGEPR
jgi:hypothetical protein